MPSKSEQIDYIIPAGAVLIARRQTPSPSEFVLYGTSRRQPSLVAPRRRFGTMTQRERIERVVYCFRRDVRISFLISRVSCRFVCRRQNRARSASLHLGDPGSSMLVGDTLFSRASERADGRDREAKYRT